MLNAGISYKLVYFFKTQKLNNFAETNGPNFVEKNLEIYLIKKKLEIFFSIFCVTSLFQFQLAACGPGWPDGQKKQCFRTTSVT